MNHRRHTTDARVQALRSKEPGLVDMTVPPLLRARLAAGERVRWGAMVLKGWWAQPDQIEYLEAVALSMPGGTRWLRLGGPGSPFTAEDFERLPEPTR